MNCKGSIRLGTACGKCQQCAMERENIRNGYYWVLPRGEDRSDPANWEILFVEGGVFWQTGSDAAVAPWHIERLGPNVWGGKVKVMDRLTTLLAAAESLRQKQRAYMTDRGNDELGTKVAIAAMSLDSEIEAAAALIDAEGVA